MFKWNEDHIKLRADYWRTLERGKVVCTINDMLDTLAYTVFCRRMFDNYSTELRRIAPGASYAMIIDFLTKG